MPNPPTSETSGMERLKECPFCGGIAEYRPNQMQGGALTIASCTRCGAEAFWKKWNTRSTSEGVERPWFPHLDYAGEPMEPGEFRDPASEGVEQTARELLATARRCLGTSVCHQCGYDNEDREWPLRLDGGVRGALEAASRLIQQMDRDKAWISADVSTVIGQIAEALSTPSKEEGR